MHIMISPIYEHGRLWMRLQAKNGSVNPLIINLINWDIVYLIDIKRYWKILLYNRTLLKIIIEKI